MNLSTESRDALVIAQSIAKEYMHPFFEGEHLLFALLHNDIGLASELVSYGKDIHYLRDWAEVRLENLAKSNGSAVEIEASHKLGTIYEVAEVNKLKLGHDQITPVCLLLAILKPSVVFDSDQLKTFPLNEGELISCVLQDRLIGINNSKNEKTNNTASLKDSTSGYQNVLKYCQDKTDLARQGKYDTIIGRDSELRMLKEILGRRTKPNVIIVGEPGVGKSALVEAFALDIINEKVPEFLKGVNIYELDLGSLMAGASYKGELEDRLKKLIAEIKQIPGTILFIDEIHMLINPNGSFQGASNLLKPELARGELTVIGATTLEEYRKYIEVDDAFSRRFDVVKVEEPDSVSAFHMIRNIAPNYEKHHGLAITEYAIKESISLSQRYFRDRKLPDSAIDLIDQTMSAVRLMNETSAPTIQQYRVKISEANGEASSRFDASWIFREIKNSLSPILLGKMSFELQAFDGENDDISIDKLEYIESFLEEVEKHIESTISEISDEEIKALVSQKSGIPLGKLQSDEKEKLIKLEEILNKRVIGQSHALNIISEAIRESRAGLLKQGQPIGSFFFMGPTGTGKTELAKAMADFLFNDESALIRFDMSEFKEEHSVALLYGAPPGYVGYEEGGLLVNKIRQRPYSIVLFDEIEKAHTSVFDLFLQILDEGKLHDRLGNVGDFSNAIILFTSNIGSSYIVDQFEQGITPRANQLMETMTNYFRPEFLARITEIIPFAPISNSIVIKIFDIQLQKLRDILAAKKIDLKVTEAFKEKIALEDFDSKYGARPIKGKIRTFLQRPIARMIISGEIAEGDTVIADLDQDNNIKLEKENSEIQQ
jgi:ATP-dependent Clp protease ATP-binding subunit ClpB